MKKGGGKKTKRSIKKTNKRITKKYLSEREPLVISLDAQELLKSDITNESEHQQESSQELMNEINQSSQGNRIAGIDYDKHKISYGGDGEEDYEYDPSKYNGVRLDESGNISDADFEKLVISVLKSIHIS